MDGKSIEAQMGPEKITERDLVLYCSFASTARLSHDRNWAQIEKLGVQYLFDLQLIPFQHIIVCS